MTMILRAALNELVLRYYGVTKDELPPNVRGMHRCLVRGVYKGARKGYKAWLRFTRAVRDVAASRAVPS